MPSSSSQLRKNGGGEAGPVGGVGPERAVALDQADQPLGGEGRGEGGGDADRHRAAQLRRGAAAGQPRALQRRGADDDRQRDRAREQVRLVAGEAAPARRGEGRRRCGRRPGASAAAWATPSARPSAAAASPRPRSCGRVSATQHRGGAGEQADRRSPAARPAAARSGARSRSRRPPRAGRRGRGRAPRRPSNSRSSSAIVCRWPISSAAAAPACSATSKLLRSSGSISSQSQPASQGTRTMWAELETGSSSAGPWTTPSASARPRRRCSRLRRRRPRPGVPPARAGAGDQEVDDRPTIAATTR